MYEERWQVTVDDSGVTVQSPSGEASSISWSDIRGLIIKTNDSGPIGADVWWFAAGDKGSVAFPMGAAGEQQALAYFQSLPGFDNHALIRAMQSTDEATFVVWEKK